MIDLQIKILFTHVKSCTRKLLSLQDSKRNKEELYKTLIYYRRRLVNGRKVRFNLPDFINCAISQWRISGKIYSLQEADCSELHHVVFGETIYSYWFIYRYFREPIKLYMIVHLPSGSLAFNYEQKHWR